MSSDNTKYYLHQKTGLTDVGKWVVEYFLHNNKPLPVKEKAKEFTDCWNASRLNTLEDCHDESLGKTEEEFQEYCNNELEKQGKS